MERIQGDTLGQRWVLRNDESKARLLSQLKEMIQEMRRLPALGIGVSNADGGSLYDARLLGLLVTLTLFWFGPFESIYDFHRHMWSGFDAHPDFHPDLKELIAWQDGPWDFSVFTHGDLSSLNILALDDKIVGIVDWETAGWLPPYWEYTTAS